jgi:hypothetical protein
MARICAPWQCRLLPGPGGSNHGLLPLLRQALSNEGPIEVYRWRQPSLEVGGNKRRPVSPRLFLYTITPPKLHETPTLSKHYRDT